MNKQGQIKGKQNMTVTLYDGLTEEGYYFNFK